MQWSKNLAWAVELARDAAKELSGLDKGVQKRITRCLRKVAERDDPRSLGVPLGANLAGLWKYREGNYRIIARIENDRILVLRIGHRSEVYRA